jgi:16S rRNA (guanine527-N7)-methyltransferase
VHEILLKYFPLLTDEQYKRFVAMLPLYSEWNSRINVISRKDFENFYVNHVLHSLSIARVFQFKGNEAVLDLGTGGGFPGIPLAVMFPETRFVLLDSITKKIRVVNEVAGSLGLTNVVAVNSRSEEHRGQYNFVVTRAVAGFPDLIRWTSKNISKRSPRNGIIALKGGDLTEELAGLRGTVTSWRLSELFDEPFFETKKIIWLKF